MRRETRNHDQKQIHHIKSMLYLGGGVIAIALVAFLITYSVYTNSLKKQSYGNMDTEQIAKLVPNGVQNTITNDTQEASTQMGKSVEEMQNQTQENTPTEQPKIAINTTNMTKEEEQKQDSPKKQEKEDKNQTQEVKSQDPTFTKPVEGEVIKEFAKDNLVYSQTLNEWTTHLGVDIKAENTTVVKAAADGKVQAIKNDPRYGLTIMIEHANGFKTVYANLLTTEFVVEQEEVKQGQTLGTVGSSSMFEIADESHLHFEILKDNIGVDPMIYLK